MKFSIFGDWVYSCLEEELVAHSFEELQEAFKKLEKYQKKFFCVGYVSYEAHKALSDRLFISSSPLLYFGVFSCRERLKIPPINDLFFPFDSNFLDEETYIQKIKALREQIAFGNTYQGNFTTFFEFKTTIPSLHLFYLLIQKQNTAYKAYLPTPFGEILSFSPELFFCIQEGKILTRPMKGTMPRGSDPQEDEANKRFLSQDIKNRSENVMIVDLLRNDLSKVTQNGTLEVKKLFEIETYPTLFQMTSTIEGKVREDQGLFEIFQALFPCGSITGAPKKITIEILESLEQSQRGVYCGAIGVLQKDSVVFSIPIRTIIKNDLHCRYGVGSGIVWDSLPDEEYGELQTKMKFLKQQVEFSLLETILYTPHQEIQEFLEIPQGMTFLSSHLKRLKESAKRLGIKYADHLSQELQSFSFEEKKIIRVSLTQSGESKIEILPYEEVKSRVITLQEKHHRSDLDIFKTTLGKDVKCLNENGLFDVIYHRDGILLEGMRSNLVLELEDGLFTPKFENQILRGICRDILLEKGVIQERVLRVEDLKRAKRIFCANSVRGVVEVNLL